MNAGSISIRGSEEELNWRPGWVLPGQDKGRREGLPSFSTCLLDSSDGPGTSRWWVPQAELCSHQTNGQCSGRGMLKSQKIKNRNVISGRLCYEEEELILA